MDATQSQDHQGSLQSVVTGSRDIAQFLSDADLSNNSEDEGHERASVRTGGSHRPSAQQPSRNHSNNRPKQKPSSSKNSKKTKHKKTKSKKAAVQSTKKKKKRLVSASRNIWTFTIIFSTIVLLRSILDRYLTDVLKSVETRYRFPPYQSDFLLGMQKIGFVATLIFATFYGNMFHKARMILVGSTVCALGYFLCALPYFAYGSLKQEMVPYVPSYITAGVCKTGSNQTFDDACSALHEVPEAANVFSVLTAVQLLVGVGAALFIVPGLVYMEENAKPKHTPIVMGRF